MNCRVQPALDHNLISLIVSFGFDGEINLRFFLVWAETDELLHVKNIGAKKPQIYVLHLRPSETDHPKFLILK